MQIVAYGMWFSETLKARSSIGEKSLGVIISCPGLLNSPEWSALLLSAL